MVRTRNYCIFPNLMSPIIETFTEDHPVYAPWPAERLYEVYSAAVRQGPLYISAFLGLRDVLSLLWDFLFFGGSGFFNLLTFR